MRYLCCRGYVEMPLKKKALSTTLCIIMLLPLVLSLVVNPVVSADPTTGRTTLYFKDALSPDELNYDSSGSFQLLSDIPPTKQNVSSYPPLIFEDNLFASLLKRDFSIVDMETLILWGSSWAISLFDEFDGYEDIFDGFEDIFEGMKLLLPHPLRLIQCYEHTGEDSIQLNGNIEFDLNFRAKAPSRYNKNDEVNLRVYRFSEATFMPTEIANTTFSLTPGFFEKNIQKIISITNVSQKINPGQLVLFSIELVPGNKTIPSFILKERPEFLNFSMAALDFLLENFELSEFEDILDLIDEYKSLFENGEFDIDEFNLTREDFIEIIESLISISFLYDSSDFPSSVTVPFRASGDISDDRFTYYLQKNNMLDTKRPDAATQQIVNLIETEGSWTGPPLSRNKIISDASAIVYINHKDIQPFSSNMVVEAALTYGNTTLSTDSVSLERTALLSNTISRAYRFSFNDVDAGVELSYGQKIGLKISLKNTSDNRPFFRTAEVFYGADGYASILSFSLSETDNIKATTQRSPASGKIIVGDTVSYTLDVTSRLQDDMLIRIKEETFSDAEDEFWDVRISPASISVGADSNTTVMVTLTSLGNTLEAYDEKPLDIILEIIGNTGYDTVQLNAEVSSDAVTYDTIIQRPSDKELDRGINETLTFTIKNNNTGLWQDSFRFYVAVDKNLSVNVDPADFDNLDVGKETLVNVTVTIPKKTDIREAEIILTIVSKRSGIEHEIPVNITIIGPNVIESTYDFFDELASSLGLKEIFNSYAPIVLVSIIFIVIFFILIIMVFILTTKYVEVICGDSIKEILADEKANYEVTLKNPTKNTHTYLLQTDELFDSSKWKVSLSSDRVTLSGKQQKKILVTVEASEECELGEWIEFQVIVKTEGKTKKEVIPLFCSLTDGTISLSINDVFHWPKSFSKGEKVSTSLRLQNNGNLQAKGISIKLFVNNEEKNKLQELIIPAGGYADITLPWIAEKGKNDLRILVC